MGERRVLKNPFSRWVTVRYSRVPGRASLRLALALLKMGKKSRRPARQDKRTEKKPTLDTLDDDTADDTPGSRDDTMLREYSTRVIMPRHESEGIHGALRAVKKWPRVRPYWPRIRRRICTACLKQVDLTEPRYLVCSGCGEARYCSELCQRVHWAKHQKGCPAGRPG